MKKPRIAGLFCYWWWLTQLTATGSLMLAGGGV